MLVFDVIPALIAGAFGAVVGSFLNVVIYRLPRESLSIHRPARSFCPSCGTPIPWYDNLPVISYFALGGKCRFCGSRISVRYPAVEALTCLLFAALVFRKEEAYIALGMTGIERLGLFVVQFWLLAAVVAVTFIDWEFQIIPDEITYSGMVLAPAACALFPVLQKGSFFYSASLQPHLAGFLSSLAGAGLGGGTLLLVGFAGKLLLRRDALGMGDVKYMAFVGGLIGAEGVLLVFFLGCVFGSLVGIPLRALKGRQEIPFGPFLSLGTVLVLFFQPDMLYFLTNTWPAWIRTLFS